MSQIELRLRDSVADIPTLSLPTVFCGDRLACTQYAAEHGFTWRAKPNHLFGGYWVNSRGDCLLPT